MREECEAGTFDYDYFCELTKRTYELFRIYGKKETVPKEILFLFSEMYCYAKAQTRINELFEFSKEIISCMINSFSNTLIWDNEQKKFEKHNLNADKKIFPMMYKNKPYEIDVDTFAFREFVE